MRRRLSRARRVYVAALREFVRPEVAPDGLPLPPPALRFLVVGSTNVRAFLAGGETIARRIQEMLARHGSTMEALGAVLDFGVGCGRVVRHWHDLALAGVEVHGTDYNRQLVEWCRQALPFGAFEVNSLAPPLPYADNRFDLVYAYSVFTHLPAPLQRPWIEELRRVLRPGGYLYFTTHGAAFAASRLDDDERERFAKGELVERAAAGGGTNPFATFHPSSYVAEQLAHEFEQLEHLPGAGPGGTADDRGRQDVYFLRKPAS